jgi:hypothetical protein
MEATGQLHASAALPPRKEPPVTIAYEDGGLQSRSGQGCEERNSQPLPGIDP